MMDEKGCYAGNVTPQTIQRSFRGLGEQMLVAMRAELDMRLPATAPAPDNDPLQQLAEPGDYPLFTWGGKMHRLPEGFTPRRRDESSIAEDSPTMLYYVACATCLDGNLQW